MAPHNEPVIPAEAGPSPPGAGTVASLPLPVPAQRLRAVRDDNSHDALFETLLRLGDNALILGQQLSKWTSNAPTLELDIALANQSLDLLGQARLLLDHAGHIEGRGRDEDALAMLRDAGEFRNVLLVELPNGDFARTVLRQFLYGVYARNLYDAMQTSADETLRGVASKAVKEMAYHARHAGEWVVRLGDGTDESHDRLARALDELWPYTHELFLADATDEAVNAAGIAPHPGGLKQAWIEEMENVLRRATLNRPADGWRPEGGRRGVHTEHLGYILAEMQFLQRAYPGAKW